MLLSFDQAGPSLVVLNEFRIAAVMASFEDSYSCVCGCEGVCLYLSVCYCLGGQLSELRLVLWTPSVCLDAMPKGIKLAEGEKKENENQRTSLENHLNQRRTKQEKIKN